MAGHLGAGKAAGRPRAGRTFARRHHGQAGRVRFVGEGSARASEPSWRPAKRACRPLAGRQAARISPLRRLVGAGTRRQPGAGPARRVWLSTNGGGGGPLGPAERVNQSIKRLPIDRSIDRFFIEPIDCLAAGEWKSFIFGAYFVPIVVAVVGAGGAQQTQHMPKLAISDRNKRTGQRQKQATADDNDDTNKRAAGLDAPPWATRQVSRPRDMPPPLVCRRSQRCSRMHLDGHGRRGPGTPPKAGRSSASSGVGPTSRRLGAIHFRLRGIRARWRTHSFVRRPPPPPSITVRLPARLSVCLSRIDASRASAPRAHTGVVLAPFEY
jgi:hypothetical protein